MHLLFISAKHINVSVAKKTNISSIPASKKHNTLMSPIKFNIFTVAPKDGNESQWIQLSTHITMCIEMLHVRFLMQKCGSGLKSSSQLAWGFVASTLQF
jgi:hypothetical protein